MQSWLLFGLCEPLGACTFKQTLVRHGGREESLLWVVYKKEDMFIIGVLVDQHFILAYAKASSSSFLTEEAFCPVEHCMKRVSRKGSSSWLSPLNVCFSFLARNSFIIHFRSSASVIC